jgi:hypothetical protein
MYPRIAMLAIGKMTRITARREEVVCNVTMKPVGMRKWLLIMAYLNFHYWERTAPWLVNSAM